MIVSLVPYWPEAVFPLMNMAFMWLGVIMLDGFFRRLGFSGRESFWGVGLYIFSFPVFWYAPYAVTDPSAMFFRIAGIYLGFTEHFFLAGLSALAGVHARQDLLAVPIMLAIYYFWQKKYFRSEVMIGFLLAGMAGIAAVAYLFREAFEAFPFQTVLLSWSDQKYFNLTFRAFMSLVTGIGPVGGLAFFALFARGRDWEGIKRETIIFLLIALGVSWLTPVYAFLVARFDARTVWQTYIAMIPFSLIGIRAIQRMTRRPTTSLQAQD